MTPSAATTLAMKISQTWPTMKIPPDLWENALAQLDEGAAGTAYVRMAANHPHPPTIADFHAVYRGLQTTGLQPVRDDCQHCGKTGWVKGVKTINEIEYEQLKPCVCSNGRQYDHGFNITVKHNANELDRAFPGRNETGPRWSAA